jgi:hypothetical protein
MKLADQIKECRTPQEALLLLASEIDALRAEIVVPLQPADPWEQPLQWDIAVEPVEGEFKRAVDIELLGQQRADDIVEVESLLAAETDPDEQRALKAKLWLLRNPGRVKPEVAEGQRATVEGDDLVVPPATPERMEARRNWARNLKLWEFISLDTDDSVQMFAKGGPIWLYEGNRDAVMAMPFVARQWLVDDIAKDSPAAAIEISRDILKQTQSVSMADATAAIDRMSGSDA